MNKWQYYRSIEQSNQARGNVERKIIDLQNEIKNIIIVACDDCVKWVKDWAKKIWNKNEMNKNLYRIK